MRRLILVTLFSIGFNFIGYSQADFRNGFIVTLSKDTLRGWVSYREGSKAHTICEFKDTKDQPSKSFLSDQLVGYGFIDDKYFESREVNVNEEETGRVFLEVIVKGLVSLYNYDGIYFVEKNGGELQILSNKLVETEVNGKKGIKNTNRHVGTLNILMFDCIALREKIQQAKLKEKLLTRLVEDYNNCKGEKPVIYKAKKPWIKFMVGLSGGLNSSRLQFADNVFEQLLGSFEIDNSFLGGLSFDVLSPRIHEHLSLHGDLLYLNAVYYSFNLIEIGSSARRNYITLKVDQLKMPLAVRYSFPGKKFAPFFNAGVSSTIHLSTSSKWSQEVESNGIVQTNEGEAMTFKKYQFGFWAGAGVTIPVHSRLTGVLELRLEQTNGISSSSFVPSSISNFQIVLGIRTK